MRGTPMQKLSSFCLSLCYSLFFLLAPSLMLFFITSFYHFLFLCFLMLFFLFLPSVSLSLILFFVFYHSITSSFCVSLCYSLFLPSITFSYVIIFFLNHSITSSFCVSLCYSLFTSFYHFLHGRQLAPLLKSSDLTSRCYNCERSYLPNTPKHAKTRQKITLRFGMFRAWHVCR